MNTKFILTLLACAPSFGFAQDAVTLDQAVALGLKNNPGLQYAVLDVQRLQALKNGATEIPKTEIMWMHGQYNSIVQNDNNITIAQTIPFPTAVRTQRAVAHAQVLAGEWQRAMSERDLVLQIRQTFYDILFLQAKHVLLLRQDSIFSGFVRSASLRFKTGESNLLEKTSAETQLAELRNMIRLSEADQQIAIQKLSTITNAPITTVTGTLSQLPAPLDAGDFMQNPQLKFWEQQVVVAEKQKRAEAAKALPDIKIGYFNQSLIGFQNVNGTEQYYGASKRFQGFEAGLAIPLWFRPYHQRTQALRIHNEMATRQMEMATLTLRGQWQAAAAALEKNKSSLAYYKETAVPNAQMLTRQNDLAFKNGESDYVTFLVNARSVLAIEQAYLETINQYNQSVIYLEYLTATTNPH